jgi:hypothetical protein
MKKILSVLLFIITFSAVNAQTAQETVDWLMSQHTARPFKAISNVISWPGTFEIEFNVSYIKISSSDGAWTKLPWSNVKMINGYINIIDYGIDNNKKNYFIKLDVSSDKAESIKKALVHLATLNNAKLIKEDLFTD